MADKAQSAVDGLLALTLEGSEEKGDEIPSRRQAEVKNLDVPPLDDALLLSRHRFSNDLGLDNDWTSRRSCGAES